MPKIYKQNCAECKKYYQGIGKYVCSYKCAGLRMSKFTKGKKPWNFGIPHSEEAKKKMSLARIGNKYCVGRIPWNKGKKISYSPHFKMRGKIPWNKGQEGLKGDKNPNWKGGITNNPYPADFNREFKRKIRERDEYTCQLCRKTDLEEFEEFGRVLCVNHIDFDKNNLSLDNLNTLCLRCNVKINYERNKYTKYFQERMIYGF